MENGTPRKYPIFQREVIQSGNFVDSQVEFIVDIYRSIRIDGNLIKMQLVILSNTGFIFHSQNTVWLKHGQLS